MAAAAAAGAGPRSAGGPLAGAAGAGSGGGVAPGGLACPGSATDPFPGHLPLLLTPDRIVEPTVAFWQYILNGDSKAHDLLVGPNCGLCAQSADYVYGENGL